MWNKMGQVVFFFVQDTLSFDCYQSYEMPPRIVKTRRHLKLELSKKCGRHDKSTLSKLWFVGRIYKIHRKFGKC